VADAGPALDFIAPLDTELAQARQDVERFRKRIDQRVTMAEEIESLIARLDNSPDPSFARLVEEKAMLMGDIQFLESSIRGCARAPFKMWRVRCGVE
jgi:hypothetical protein